MVRKHSFLTTLTPTILFKARDSNSLILLVASILIAALIADTMINNVADFLSGRIDSNWGIALYIA